ncbi:MAG: hypothetical protein E7638_04745 [Ruminococcaceae bacterium]|nr:hypothetical protein [Oscillospiraceae bacterium]
MRKCHDCETCALEQYAECKSELEECKKALGEAEKTNWDLHELVRDGAEREARYCEILRKLGYEPLTGTLNRLRLIGNLFFPKL